jgi:hypothetical protein
MRDEETASDGPVFSSTLEFGQEARVRRTTNLAIESHVFELKFQMGCGGDRRGEILHPIPSWSNLEAKAIVRLWSRPLRSSNVIHPLPFAGR